MPSYTLELEVFGNYGIDAPILEIWADGVLDSSYSVLRSGTSISLTMTYGGAMPSSLEFRFNDGSSETGRSIEIRTIKVNDRHIDNSTYLSTTTLVNGGTSTVDVPKSQYIFDASVDPTAADFVAGATQTLTSSADTLNILDSTTNEIFDALDGRDVIYTGSGDDKISGGAGDDIIRSGAGEDTVFGDVGADRIYGGAGDDILYGGDGNDRVHGEEGNDIIHGGLGNDTLNGHDGNDIITGGEGNDKLNGGNNDDRLYGDNGSDQLVGGAGNDFVDGGTGDDVVYGGAGDDSVFGGDGNDFVIGNDGDDIVHGGDGNDTVYGQADNDSIHGGNGDDTLLGGDGQDTLTGGRGDDILNGGDGNDIISATTFAGAGVTVADILAANPNVSYNAATGNFYEYVASATRNVNYSSAVTAAATYTINGVAAHLATITSAAEDSFIGGLVNNNQYGWIGLDDSAVEGTFRWNAGPEAGDATTYTNYTGGGGPSPNSATADNVLYWDGGGDVWYVWAGTNNAWGYVAEWEGSELLSEGVYDSSTETNTLIGGAGNDQLFGSMGDDFFEGGAGDDTITGGAGNDTLSFANATNGVTIDLANETVSGEGNDSFSSIENIIGSDFGDMITGGSEDNIITAGAGDDTIIGGGGSGTLTGGDGADIIAAGTSTSSGVSVADILAANPNLTYSAVTGNFYEFVAGNINYANAVTAAGNYTVNGVAAHLATITSAAEDSVIGGIGNGGYGWIGLDDSAVEGTFRWNAGPETGDLATYTNYFGGGGPNPNSATADNVLYYHGGGNTWYVWSGNNSATGYVAEWEGSAVLNNIANITTDTVSLVGGDGADVLYGAGSIDTFIFESISAFNDVDQIENFVTGSGGDSIDLSDLLIGYSGPVSNWVNLVDNGGNSILQVDVDGTANGVNFVDVAQINGITGLDEVTLLGDGNLIL